MSEETPPVPTQEFLTLAFVKQQQEITDNQYDSRMTQMVEFSNRQMQLALIPVLDKREFADTGFFEDARNTAFLHFKSLFEKRINKDDETAKSYMDEYKYSLKILIEAIKAQPTKSTRSKVAYGTAVTDSPLLKNIPGMTDKYGRLFEDRNYSV